MLSSSLSSTGDSVNSTRRPSETPPSPLAENANTISKHRRLSGTITSSGDPSQGPEAPLFNDETLSVMRPTITLSQLISLLHTAEGLRFFTEALHLQDIRTLMRISKAFSAALTAACLGHCPLTYLTRWICNGELAKLYDLPYKVNERILAIDVRNIRIYMLNESDPTSCYCCFIGICSGCPQFWTTLKVCIPGSNEYPDIPAYSYKSRSIGGQQQYKYYVKLCSDCFQTIGTNRTEIERMHKDLRDKNAEKFRSIGACLFFDVRLKLPEEGAW